MARSVILSNGRLAVGLNEKGHVHDFYYPYVGLDNLTTARSVHHKVGVWVDGEFSWTDDQEWHYSVDFSSEALVSDIEMSNDRLGVSIFFNDFVDYEYDALCRMVYVKNNTSDNKSVRLFMHQVFEISRAGRADTALYVPDEHYILDYKGRCCLLIAGRSPEGTDFDEYAVGNYGIEGKKGTFVDAEDGELSNHPVEHGGVDSVLRYSFELKGNGEQQFDYWVVASDSQFNGEAVHHQLKKGLKARLTKNEEFWKKWLSTGDDRLSGLGQGDRALVNKSLMVIKAHSDARGGIIASCDSSIYNYGRDYYSYVWPRDGAYAMWPLIRLGYKEEPKLFFKFCKDILTPEGYLMHKYQPDRAIGSTWHPLLHNNRRELAIQEDETASVIIMLGEFYQVSKDSNFTAVMFKEFVLPAADFLASFIDDDTGLPHASYDLWEEKFLCSTYTAATVFRALLTSADLADEFGSKEKADEWRIRAEEIFEKRQTFVDPDKGGYRKGFLLNPDKSLEFDNTHDMSSIYGVITFGFFGDEDKATVQEALKRAETELMNSTPSGGAPRYENDNYFRVGEQFLGNPWLISGLWLAQFYTRQRRIEEAEAILDWTKLHTLPSGVMPEQVHPETGGPLSVTPLVWSHAEFINTVLDIAHIKKDGR